MDVQSYCDMLGNQLVAWKAKIYDVIRVVDALPEIVNVGDRDGGPVNVVPFDREKGAAIEGEVLDAEDPCVAVELEEDPLPDGEGEVVALGGIAEGGE